MERPGLRHLKRYAFLPIPVAFYLLTMARTVGFNDTVLLINDIQRHGVTSHVNCHPLTVLTGMLFNLLVPVAELAVRAHLVSVFYGSLTACLFYLLLLARFRSVLTAVIGTSLLLVLHSLWWHSTLIENYAASACITMACLHFWHRLETTGERRWLYLLCGFAGLGILNHVQMSFLCLGVATTGIMVARAHRSWQILWRCAAAAALGLLPWMALLLRAAKTHGSLSLAVKEAFVGSFSQTFFAGKLWASLWDTTYVFWFQSPTLYMPLFGIIGVLLAYRQRRGNAVFCGMIVPLFLNTANFAFYPTWDKFAFLLLSFLILHFFAAHALHALLERARSKRYLFAPVLVYWAVSLALPPFLYTNIATWALSPSSRWYWRYTNEYSLNTYFHSEYIVNPDKSRYNEVDGFVRLLFTKLPAGATYLDDDSRTYYAVADYFQKYYGLRPDVSAILVNSWGIENWGLTPEAASDLMIKAYYLDRPFFSITIVHPLNQVIAPAMARAPGLEFVPYPLAPKRWIYRLRTQSEAVTPDKALPIDQVKFIEKLDVSQPEGFIDLSPGSVAYFQRGVPAREETKKFAGKWQGDDQLFVSGERAGATLDFFLRTPNERMVDLTFALTRAVNYGTIQIEVLPSGAQQTVDLYDARTHLTEVKMEQVKLQPGVNTLRLHVVGKHERATGFSLGIDGFRYAPSR